MLSRIEVFLKRFRRNFSRSEWTIRLLQLERPTHPADGPGLVMVQIDGLSMTQFNHALQKGNLPFLQSLLSRERYILRSFYSGLPSMTAAVQAELFYGVKGCVPSFHFLDRQSGRTVKMLDSKYVEKVEKILSGKGSGLLAGGSAYSDVFNGGAKESHCCWARMAWEGVPGRANPLVFPILFLLYADIFIRTMLLVAIEFFIAVFECMRGTLKGRLFFRELELVWLRSLVCVFLRELITAGACLDIRRGAPVVHVNFLGYDEQAHGRGPSSDFAHWSLRGIDGAIRRIYDAINESPGRHYDLWVYSDHGQAETTPYYVKYGRSIEDAVHEVFGEALPHSNSRPDTRHETTRSRAFLLKRSRTGPSAPPAELPAEKPQRPLVMVTATGPLGHVYVNKPLTASEMHGFAKKLVSQAGIPLVLTRDGLRVLAWTPAGCSIFSNDAHKIFGSDHPFKEEIREDMLRVCFHPDAGDFIIAGWCQGFDAISFPLEYGAHASMGPEETHAFTLLPMDAPVDLERGRNYFRPCDLRHTARRYLDKKRGPKPTGPGAYLKNLTLMSYNVHGCAGMDGTISTDRITRVIARYNPDIIALQELDVGRLRSGKTDQAELIAGKLEMNYHFHPAFRSKDEQYGNAILSRYPMALIKTGHLPGLGLKNPMEPRGALWVSVEFQGKMVQIFNTHLSLSPTERMLQVNALLGEQWLQHPDCKGPVILCGDFNAFPGSAVYRKVSHSLHDSQAVLAGHKPRATWFGRYPVGRIDYVFANDGFEVRSIAVPRTQLEKTASDHLPLITEYYLTNS
jgi:endonuclease/exonuclease/phosphatase family metal-dependent hydrolase